MPPQVSWCPLPFDERRSLVYSPAWGRSYLLSAAQHDDPALRRWLGLGGARRVVTLPDPAGSVLRTHVNIAGVPSR